VLPQGDVCPFVWLFWGLWAAELPGAGAGYKDELKVR
jgi:hypothetical protein